MTTPRESLILDSVELNDLAGSYVLRTVDFAPPAKRYEWVQGADADGAELVRDPLHDQRTITAQLRVNQQPSMDAALALIAQIVGKLEEAEKQAPAGLPLVWTPANSSKSITFYVQSGEVTGIPVVVEGDQRGWFRNYPVLTVTLACKPFGYSIERSVTAVTAATPLITVDVPSVGGDVPAEARVVVTDNATQSRRDALWGVEQRYYTPGTPAALTLAAGSLVTSGFAGTSGALTGAYLTNAITASVGGQPTALCGTGNQPHVGTYRVRARIQAAGTVTAFRLAWQDGDGPFSANPWVTPPAAGALCEIDLGLITIKPATLGSQRWTGRVEAYTTDGTTQSASVNVLELIPAGEGYGRARAAYTYKPGVVVARDDFNGITTGAALNGRTAPQGGAWVTAGDTTDFTGDPPSALPTSASGIGPAMVDRHATPDAAVGRFALLGGAMTDTDVSTTMFVPPHIFGLAANSNLQGVVARYVNTTNAIRAFYQQSSGVFTVNVVIAGAGTAFNAPVLTNVPSGYFVVRLVVYATGRVVATLSDLGGAVITSVDIAAGVVPALATGGTLASGKAGLFDQGMTGTVIYGRFYGLFYAAIPQPEPIVINSGRTIEFRSDGQQRQDATGTYYGRPPAYRGGRALLQPAGDKNRTSRVVAAARRNDTDTGADGGVTDSTTLQVYWTERFLVVPH